MYLTECPIIGQIRKVCATPENCTRTCDHKKESLNCSCKPYGCECPNGTVVNHITKECVKPENCPLDKGKIYDYCIVEYFVLNHYTMC